MGSKVRPGDKRKMLTSTKTVATSPFKFELELAESAQNNRRDESSTLNREIGYMHTRGNQLNQGDYFELSAMQQ